VLGPPSLAFVAVHVAVAHEVVLALLLAQQLKKRL
jgi:hypothetical protein